MESIPSSLITSANSSGSLSHPGPLPGPPEEWALLRNAVAEPVRQMIAVEVDTLARARQTGAMLAQLDPKRPSAALEFVPGQINPEQLLEQAAQAGTGWPEEEGLLLLVDATEESKAIEGIDPAAFWRGMNQLRESWDALPGQTIFFLPPESYRQLGSLADHLKRWIALKVHLLGGHEERAEGTAQNATPGFDLISPEVARGLLAALERHLIKARQRGEAPATLTRRYYLPMFAAAVSIGDLGRAQRLRDEVEGCSISDAEQPQWLTLNCQLEFSLFQLDAAYKFAEMLLAWSEVHQDLRQRTEAFFHLGRVAHARRDLAMAEEWYKKSLEIAERQGNGYGMAANYHQLGMVAQERRDLATAENWYKKSLEIMERQGNEHGMAIIYHQLGRVAQERRDLAAAEEWHKKSLAIEERQGNERGMASSYHQRGRVAQERRDLAMAEEWYKKSLAIEERQGNERGMASSYHQLGITAGLQGCYAMACEHFLKSAVLFNKSHDPYEAGMAIEGFDIFLPGLPSADQKKLLAQWKDADLGSVPKVPFLKQKGDTDPKN